MSSIKYCITNSLQISAENFYGVEREKFFFLLMLECQSEKATTYNEMLVIANVLV